MTVINGARIVYHYEVGQGMVWTRTLVSAGIPPHVEVEWLTAAHNADSPIEQEKLKAEHPGEEDLVHCKQKIIELGNYPRQ